MSSPDSLDLDNLLLRECWSFHERLDYFASAYEDYDTTSPDNFISSCQQTWQQTIAKDDIAIFQKRLEWDNLSQKIISLAFDPPSGVSLERSQDFLAELNHLRRVAIDYKDSVFTQSIHAHWSRLPFVHFWIPIAEFGVKKLQEHPCTNDYPLFISDSAWFDLKTSLLVKLCQLTSQALWELFSKKRPPTSNLISKIQSAIPDSINTSSSTKFYEDFVVSFLSNGYNDLLFKFPVLARLLVTTFTNWFDANVELLQRIALNKISLESNYNTAPLLTLDKIGYGLSDPHKSGREVVSLEFIGDGFIFRCVYKPKDLGLDVAFQRYLHLLNTKSTFSPFRILNVLSLDGYGFVEWVDHELCENSDELVEFYFNSGRLLAVLYLLGCTDCHFENLIASSKQLVLIDTETLLEGKISSVDGDSSHSQPSFFTDLLDDSVIQTGLLPYRMILGEQKKAFDLSALGIGFPPSESHTPGWLNINSDSMVFGLVAKSNANRPCLPVQAPAVHPLREHVDDLVSGFRSQLLMVMKHKDSLYASLDLFVGQTRRLVSRNTYVYSHLIRQSLSPESLRSAVSRGIKLDRLSQAYLYSAEKPFHWQIFKSEVMQITALDIPIFEQFVDRQGLIFQDEDGLSPALLDISGLDAARNRFLALDMQSIDFQVRLIHGSLAARYSDQYKHSHLDLEVDLSDSRFFNRSVDIESMLLEKRAVASANQLWDLAILDDHGNPDWLEITPSGIDGVSNLGQLPLFLYSGSAGIACLFARLALSPSKAYAESMASKASATLLNINAEYSHADSLTALVHESPVGLDGIGGLFLALNLLNRANIDNSLHLAELVLDRISPKDIVEIQDPDILQGLSGFIGPLLSFDTPKALALAICCGERLLELQLSSGGWQSSKWICSQELPLTGFSHGASGIAAALARLAQVSNDHKFSAAALKAVDFERSVFCSASQNWPDFRKVSQPNVFKSSWCHGAPGVLLSRLIMLHAGVSNSIVQDDICIARAKTISTLRLAVSRPQRLSAHLCCGFYGLTFLLRLDSSLNNHLLHPSVHLVERRLFDELEHHGSPNCYDSYASSFHSLGLFNGLAGIGLAMAESSDNKGWMSYLLSCGLLSL